MGQTKSHQLHYIPHITTKRHTLRIMRMEVSSCNLHLKYQSNTYSTQRPQQQRGFSDVSHHQQSATDFLANKSNLATNTVNRQCVYEDGCTAMCMPGSNAPIMATWALLTPHSDWPRTTSTESNKHKADALITYD